MKKLEKNKCHVKIAMRHIQQARSFWMRLLIGIEICNFTQEILPACSNFSIELHIPLPVSNATVMKIFYCRQQLPEKYP